MSGQENRNPQYNDPQKPGEQKPKPEPVQQKQGMPGEQPKNPQSEPMKHDQEQKKQA